jgi:hypothetical protein
VRSSWTNGSETLPAGLLLQQMAHCRLGSSGHTSIQDARRSTETEGPTMLPPCTWTPPADDEIALDFACDLATMVPCYLQNVQNQEAATGARRWLDRRVQATSGRERIDSRPKKEISTGLAPAGPARWGLSLNRRSQDEAGRADETKHKSIREMAKVAGRQECASIRGGLHHRAAAVFSARQLHYCRPLSSG